MGWYELTLAHTAPAAQPKFIDLLLIGTLYFTFKLYLLSLVCHLLVGCDLWGEAFRFVWLIHSSTFRT